MDNEKNTTDAPCIAINFKLTPKQKTQLQPLFDEVNKIHQRGADKGAVLAQTWEDGRAKAVALDAKATRAVAEVAKAYCKSRKAATEATAETTTEAAERDRFVSGALCAVAEALRYGAPESIALGALSAAGIHPNSLDFSLYSEYDLQEIGKLKEFKAVLLDAKTTETAAPLSGKERIARQKRVFRPSPT